MAMPLAALMAQLDQAWAAAGEVAWEFDRLFDGGFDDSPGDRQLVAQMARLACMGMTVRVRRYLAGERDEQWPDAGRRGRAAPGGRDRAPGAAGRATGAIHPHPALNPPGWPAEEARGRRPWDPPPDGCAEEWTPLNVEELVAGLHGARTRMAWRWPELCRLAEHGSNGSAEDRALIKDLADFLNWEDLFRFEWPDSP
jgi:hypothetical protein